MELVAGLSLCFPSRGQGGEEAHSRAALQCAGAGGSGVPRDVRALPAASTVLACGSAQARCPLAEVAVLPRAGSAG